MAPAWSYQGSPGEKKNLFMNFLVLLPSLFYQGSPAGNKDLFIALLILSGIARWEQTPFYYPHYSIRDLQVRKKTFLLPSLFYQGSPGGNRYLYINFLILLGISRWEQTPFYCPTYSIRDCQEGTDTFLLTSLFYQGLPGGNTHLFITPLFLLGIVR